MARHPAEARQIADAGKVFMRTFGTIEEEVRLAGRVAQLYSAHTTDPDGIEPFSPLCAEKLRSINRAFAPAH